MSQCYTLHSELIMHLQFLSLGGNRNPGCGQYDKSKKFSNDER
jgi:hypothetical protein